jgi:hypothetical protein
MTHYRNNGTPPHGTADGAFEAMQRHNAKLKSGTASNTRAPPAAATGGNGSRGDGRGSGTVGLPHPPGEAIVYGAREIAFAIFGDRSDRARRRVFCIAAHYRARKEDAGFFKLKGALCLSMSKWRKFHGLD